MREVEWRLLERTTDNPADRAVSDTATGAAAHETWCKQQED